jgi:hypothetical protein
MSNEFFSLDLNGQKSDAALHGEILDNPEADLANRTDTARRAVVDGMSEDDARLLYGIPATVTL